MRGTTFRVVLLLSICVKGIVTSAWAADEVCRQHKPDPTIDAHAKDLALSLSCSLMPSRVFSRSGMHMS
jgi:hypothetical protein